MNEAQLKAQFDALDTALAGVPDESRADIVELFGNTIKESFAAQQRAEQAETELEKVTGPAPLTKEKIMSEKDSVKRMKLIRENPMLFDPNAEKPKKEYATKEEVMQIKDRTERITAIQNYGHLFKGSAQNEFKNQFEGGI